MPRHAPIGRHGIVRARQVDDVKLIVIAVDHHLKVTVPVEVLNSGASVHFSGQTQHWKSRSNRAV